MPGPFSISVKRMVFMASAPTPTPDAQRLDPNTGRYDSVPLSLPFLLDLTHVPSELPRLCYQSQHSVPDFYTSNRTTVSMNKVVSVCVNIFFKFIF